MTKANYYHFLLRYISDHIYRKLLLSVDYTLVCQCQLLLDWFLCHLRTLYQLKKYIQQN